MPTTQHVILPCIDGSSVSDAVIDYACWVSKMMNQPMKLLHTIEHQANAAVSDLTGSIGLGTQDELLGKLTDREQECSRQLIQAGQALLSKAGGRVVATGLNKPEMMQMHGTLPESLVELEDQIAVLIVGIRGETQERRSKDIPIDHPDRRKKENQEAYLSQKLMGIGKQLEPSIRCIHRPILVVNTKFTEPKKAMLCYDGSESSLKALHIIASNPMFKNLPCHVVHIGNKGEQLLEEAAHILSNAKVDVTTSLLTGNIVKALSDYQEENDIDITLMGAFSHSRIRGIFFGSLTASMLAKSNRPLFMLR